MLALMLNYNTTNSTMRGLKLSIEKSYVIQSEVTPQLNLWKKGWKVSFVKTLERIR